MHKTRLEAFSDGVLAIIITIMVLEIKVPHGTGWEDIKPLIPIALSYLFSFIYVGIYWNNHHHMFLMVQSVNGRILWCNLHLLFWLSLLPFATGWIDENHFSSIPVAFYGFILFMCGTAWKILTIAIFKNEGPSSRLKQAFKNDFKTTASIVGYIAGIALAFPCPMVSVILYIVVALIWVVPDTRIEKHLHEE